MNTTGRVTARWAGWLITVEKMSIPGGAIQTLEPRPRPATWVVAETVKPLGSFGMSLGFLLHVNLVSLLFGRGNILLKHCICTCDNFAVHEQVTPCSSGWLNLPITLQA